MPTARVAQAAESRRACNPQQFTLGTGNRRLGAHDLSGVVQRELAGSKTISQASIEVDLRMDARQRANGHGKAGATIRLEPIPCS
jgi:hypothetical protein